MKSKPIFAILMCIFGAAAIIPESKGAGVDDNSPLEGAKGKEMIFEKPITFPATGGRKFYILDGIAYGKAPPHVTGQSYCTVYTRSNVSVETTLGCENKSASTVCTSGKKRKIQISDSQFVVKGDPGYITAYPGSETFDDAGHVYLETSKDPLIASMSCSRFKSTSFFNFDSGALKLWDLRSSLGWKAWMHDPDLKFGVLRKSRTQSVNDRMAVKDVRSLSVPDEQAREEDASAGVAN